MKFKKNASDNPSYVSDDGLYALENGYMDAALNGLRNKSDLDAVLAAVATIREFLDSAEEAGALEWI